MNYEHVDISDLLILLEKASPFSEDAMHIHDELAKKTEAVILGLFAHNVMPVFRVNEALLLGIHPSAKSYPDGYVQVTRFSTLQGVLGDSQYSSVRAAIQSEGLFSMDRLSEATAAECLGLTLAAELEYSNAVGQHSHSYAPSLSERL